MDILSYISQEKDQQHGVRNICGPQPVQIRQDASRSHSSVPSLMTPHSEWLSSLEFGLAHFTRSKDSGFYSFSIEASSNGRWYEKSLYTQVQRLSIYYAADHRKLKFESGAILPLYLGFAQTEHIWLKSAVFCNNALAMITRRKSEELSYDTLPKWKVCRSQTKRPSYGSSSIFSFSVCR